MENKPYYDDTFIVYLTIEGTSYENVEIEVSDPSRPIKEQINSIMQVFGLSKAFQGIYVDWHLGREVGDDIIFFLDHEEEQSLLDFNVQSGDSLRLSYSPLVGLPFLTLHLAFDRGCKYRYSRYSNGYNGIDRIMVDMYEFVSNNVNVEYFTKHFIELLHLPLFLDGYYVKYGLDYWDKESQKYVKCDSFRPLRYYIPILINHDKNAVGDWKMCLYGELSENRNYRYNLLEKWSQKFNHILYNKGVLIN